MAQAERGQALTTFAILFGLLAISNLLKPFQFGGEQTGFVFFGSRLSGAPNAIIGPVFGIFLAVYAYAIWNMRRFAIPMAPFAGRSISRASGTGSFPRCAKTKARHFGRFGSPF